MLDALKCKQCKSFITSLITIKHQIKDIITNLHKNNANDTINQFLIIFELFKNNEFINYHSLIKLENIVLFTINLIIEGAYQTDYKQPYIDILKTLLNNQVEFIF